MLDKVEIGKLISVEVVNLREFERGSEKEKLKKKKYFRDNGVIKV